MTSWLLGAIAGLAVSLIAVWLILAIAYVLVRPDHTAMREAARLPADMIVMLRRLLSNGDLPRAARVRLWLLVGYLAMPIDLVPDFIPVIGYADDIVVTALLLRGAIRRVGFGRVECAWPGSATGLTAIKRLCNQ